MPKIVDHAARRQELAGAVWALVGRGGFPAATVRAVAQESGWSMGAVRYYFATQAELVRFAMEVMAERVAARIQRLYVDPATGERLPCQDRWARALEALAQLVPLDEERRIEVLVWLEFVTRARVDADLAEPLEESWHGERYVARLALRDALDAPLPGGPAAPLAEREEAAAARLQVGVDGLTLQAVTFPEHWPAQAARAELKAQLRLAVAQARGWSPPA